MQRKRCASTACFVAAGSLFGGLVDVTHGAVRDTILCRQKTKTMQAAELLSETTYPLRKFATLVPMFVSWLLFSVAFVFGLFGLFLFIATVVPFFGYLMSLLEARAHGRDAPPFDAELMAFFGNAWSLFPLVIVALLAWLQYAVEQNYSAGAAVLVTAVASTIFPAFLGVLSVTRAPLQGLNPIALGRFIQSTGVDYLILIVMLQAVSLALYLLFQTGTPLFFLGLGLPDEPARSSRERTRRAPFRR